MTGFDERGASPQHQSRTWIWIVAAVLVVTLFACGIVVVAGLLLAFFAGARQQVALPPQLTAITVTAEVDASPREETARASTEEDTQPLPQGAPYEVLQQTIDHTGAVGFAIGDPDAPVTVVEYSDFSCPHCHDLVPAIQQIIAEYGPTGAVRVVYKPIVFVNPATSVPAGIAAYCAAEQGLFWQMHDAIWSLYVDQGASAYTPERLTRAAVSARADEADFTACFESDEPGAALDQVLDEALNRGVQGTPTLFVNGEDVPYTGPDSIYDDLVEVIEAILDSDPVDG